MPRYLQVFWITGQRIIIPGRIVFNITKWKINYVRAGKVMELSSFSTLFLVLVNFMG